MTEEIKSKDVRVYPCATWDEFITQMRRTRYMPKEDPEEKAYHFGAGVIYRGHSKPSYRLSSTMERNCVFKSEVLNKNGKPIKDGNLRTFNGLDWYDKHCEHILQRFKVFSRGIGGIGENLTVAELWTIGRHFGLLSPYLDWTASPFVAAFFAFEEIYKKFQYMKSNYQTLPTGNIVQVWGLRIWKDLEEDEIFEISQMPGHHSTRPRAQQTWFTKLRSTEHIDVQSYLESRQKAHYLERYDLNVEMAMTALRDLDLMNINYLTLFPDAVGSALHSNIDADNFRVALAMHDLNREK